MEDKFQWYKPGFLPALLFLTGSIVLSFSLPGGGESVEGIQLRIITHAVFFLMFFLMDEGLLGLGRWNFAAPLAALDGGRGFCLMLNYYWYTTHGSTLQLPISFSAFMCATMLAAALAAFVLNHFLRRPVPTENQPLPLLPATMAKSSWVYWERVEAKWMDGIIALTLLFLAVFNFRAPSVGSLVFLLIFGTLTLIMIGGFRYSISRERIRLRWGWARIPLLNLRMSDVTEVEAMESGVFGSFGGFGIRYSFNRGWGFVLRNNAVCLKTRQGRRVAFSAGNPVMVAELIKAATQQNGLPETEKGAIETPGNKQWRMHIPAVIIILSVLAVIYPAYREPGVAFDSNAFRLKGLYGVNIPLDEIAGADLIALHEMPAISTRANGISLFKVHRGHFRTTAGDDIRLSIYSGVNPVIRIVDHNGNAYYINRKNPDETRQIFKQLNRK